MHTPEHIKQTPLSYAEFTEWKAFSPTSKVKYPTHNNFYLMFLDIPANVVARNKQIIKQLAKEHPELEKKLSNAVTSAYKGAGKVPDINIILPALEPLLYQAYCIMHQWVSDDEELFV